MFLNCPKAAMARGGQASERASVWSPDVSELSQSRLGKVRPSERASERVCGVLMSLNCRRAALATSGPAGERASPVFIY